MEPDRLLNDVLAIVRGAIGWSLETHGEVRPFWIASPKTGRFEFRDDEATRPAMIAAARQARDELIAAVVVSVGDLVLTTSVRIEAEHRDGPALDLQLPYTHAYARPKITYGGMRSQQPSPWLFDGRAQRS